ncbi:OsmC/Ohr family protein, partial [Kipferlia bialata]
ATAAMVAHEYCLPIKSIDWSVTSDVDMSHFMCGGDADPLPMHSVRVKARVAGPLSDDQMELLSHAVSARCPCAALLSRVGGT